MWKLIGLRLFSHKYRKNQFCVINEKQIIAYFWLKSSVEQLKCIKMSAFFVFPRFISNDVFQFKLNVCLSTLNYYKVWLVQILNLFIIFLLNYLY